MKDLEHWHGPWAAMPKQLVISAPILRFHKPNIDPAIVLDMLKACCKDLHGLKDKANMPYCFRRTFQLTTTATSRQRLCIFQKDHAVSSGPLAQPSRHYEICLQQSSTWSQHAHRLRHLLVLQRARSEQVRLQERRTSPRPLQPRAVLPSGNR